MISGKLRRSGNSFVVTVPRDEVERLGLTEGQTVIFEVRPAEICSLLAPDIREAFEIELRRGEAGLRYLAEH